jgi:hypothetical protein
MYWQFIVGADGGTGADSVPLDQKMKIFKNVQNAPKHVENKKKLDQNFVIIMSFLFRTNSSKNPKLFRML